MVIQNLKQLLSSLLQSFLLLIAQQDGPLEKSVDSLIGNGCEMAEIVIVSFVDQVEVSSCCDVYEMEQGLFVEGCALGFFLYVYVSDYFTVKVAGLGFYGEG